MDFELDGRIETATGPPDVPVVSSSLRLVSEEADAIMIIIGRFLHGRIGVGLAALETTIGL